MSLEVLSRRTTIVKPLIVGISTAVAAVLADETIVARHSAYLATDEFVRTALNFRADDQHMITSLLAVGSLLMLASCVIDVVGPERAHARTSNFCSFLSLGYIVFGAAMYIACLFLEGDRHTLADDVCLVALFPPSWQIIEIASILGGVIALYSVFQSIQAYLRP